MIGIIDAIKRIYSGTNVLVKHVWLFVLTGLMTMASLPLNTASEATNLSKEQALLMLGLSLLAIVIAIYTCGYLYDFVHNSYDRENKDILPDINWSHFKTGFKTLLIALCWIGYGILVSIITVLAIAVSKYFGLLVTLVFAILGILFLMMQPMLYVDFARNLSTKGLKGILQPFRYIKDTMGEVTILLLKMCPIYILIFILEVVCYAFQNVLTYIIFAICGYLMYIYGMVLSHQYAQILDEKYSK